MMKRYIENPNHAFPSDDPHMHESRYGDWVKWEDVQKAVQNLFEAKTFIEWVSAVVELGTL